MDSRGTQRDRITANRSDTIIKKNRKHTYCHVSIPADRNVMQKKVEKKIKTQEFICRETHRMWNMKCVIIPVITGTTGMVTKVLK